MTVETKELEYSLTEFPILEPLSKATEEPLKPLNLQPNDYLEIGMDVEGEHFNMKAISLRRPRTDEESRLQDNPNLLRKTLAGDTLVLSGFPSWEAQRFFYRIPERDDLGAKDWQRRGVWKIGLTDYSAIIVRHCWPRDRLIFRSKEARTYYEFLLARFFAQNARAELQARFKIEKEVPDDPSDFKDHEKLPLSDYQKVALQFCLEQEASALFMEQGTGKTPPVIARICLEAKRIWKKEKRMMRVLIACPQEVRLNWQNEFSRFSTAPGKVTIIRGGKLKRIKLLTHSIRLEDECVFTVVVMSYDTLSADYEVFKTIPWDLVVTDESHYFKSKSTKRFKSLVELREVSEARMALTGTPMGNSIMDLWTQLEFLGKGLSGFSSFEKFRQFHLKFEDSVADASGNSVAKIVGVSNIPLMQERLARLSFAITKEEAALGLPDKVYDTYEIEMTPKQREYYCKLRDSLILELQEELDTSENVAVTANHILTQLLRLAQVTSGFLKTDDVIDLETMEVKMEGSVHQISKQNPKVEAALNIIREKSSQEKTIIWCCFVEDIRVLSERLTEEGIIHGCFYGSTSQAKREEYVNRFNNEDEFRVLVANPATAGTGLNLLGYNPERDDQETYCNQEIFFSQNWSYLQRAQAEDRAHRRGTKMPVRITDLTVPGTIDEEIRARVQAKHENAQLIQDVSSILKSVLSMEID